MTNTEQPPFSRIVCPMGLVNRDYPKASPSSLQALRTGGRLAGAGHTVVFSLYVVPTFVMHMSGFREKEDADSPHGIGWEPIAAAGLERIRPDDIARTRVAEYLRATLPSGVRGEVLVRIGEPADEILAVASELEADLILMPARRTTDGVPSGGPLGRVTYRVARSAGCSVLVLR